MALGNYEKKDPEKIIAKPKTSAPVSKIAAKVNKKTNATEAANADNASVTEAPVEDKKEKAVVAEPQKVESKPNVKVSEKQEKEVKKPTDQKKEEPAKKVEEKAKVEEIKDAAVTEEKKPEDTKAETIETETKQARISAMISVKAEEVTKKWMGIYGYKKLTPFVVDVLEGLDLYLTETDEEGKIPRKNVKKGLKPLGVGAQSEDDEKPIKISIVLSDDANDRLNYWMPIYGEKKISVFVDYVLKNLDMVLKTE